MGFGHWLLTNIVNAIISFFNVLVIQPIGQIIGWIGEAIFWLVTEFLKATVFAPLSIDPLHPGGHGGIVAAAAASYVFDTMAAASVGVALFALTWVAFTNTWGSFAGRSQFARSAWADSLEGVGIWLLVLVGGYAFLSALLDAMNRISLTLISFTEQYQANWIHPAAFASTATGVVVGGLATFAGDIIVNWLWPTALLVLAGFMLWAVIVWAMRVVDLIVFVGLLPVTAALAITGNKRAWQWNWAEAMGAVFSQLAMVVMWWIAWLIIGGPLTVNSGDFITDLVRILIGIFAMFMVSKAPQMMQQITGHSHAGVGGMMMAAAGGYMLGRGAMSAARMSPLGQAAGKMAESYSQRSQAKLSNWAAKPEIGSGATGQGFMQRATQAGKSVLGAAGLTGTGQVVSGAARHMWAGLETKAPGVASVMRAAGGATAGGARAAGGVGKAILQPNRTLGQSALRADALKYNATDSNASHDYAVQAGARGYEAMMPPDQRGQVSQAFQRMVTARDPNEYAKARADYENVSSQARHDVLERVMGAPHGDGAYRSARDVVQRKGVQPRPTTYS